MSKEKGERDLSPEISRYLEVSFPEVRQKQKKSKVPILERTALYVETEKLMQTIPFEQGKKLKNVLITHDVHSLLKLILHEGRIGRRFGEKGLENDLTKQQVILYTLIRWRDFFLVYQRPEEKDVEKKEGQYLGDKRLRGRVSIGFGGHKTLTDLESAARNLLFIGELFPGLMPEMSNIVGLNIGFLAELEEELGIRSLDCKQLTLLGGFRDLRLTKEQSGQVNVSHVHTAILGVLELKDDVHESVSFLKLPIHEFKAGYWVRAGNIKKDLKQKRLLLEGWSEVVIEEFMNHYESVKKVGSRKAHLHLQFER